MRTLWPAVIGITLLTAGCGDSARRPSGGDGGVSYDADDDGLCVSDTVSRVSDAYCSSTTSTCIDGCDNNDCVYNCLDADPSPDCSACFNVNVVACANANGCQDLWDAYSCCIDRECGADAGTSCIDTAIDGACGGDMDRYNECVGMLDFNTVCPNVLADCF